MTDKKPILCIDFDGVLHSYTSGWVAAHLIPDLPVPGAISFIQHAADFFTIAVYSSRSHQPGGIDAMKDWLYKHMRDVLGEADADWLYRLIEWPVEKPPAFLTIDDRALQFTGKWPMPADLLDFKPWNKR